MKLRLYCEDYMALMKEIRDRAESGEWRTWSVVRVRLTNGKTVRRLIHTSLNDNQYKDIQIKLIIPSKAAIKNGEHYLDMIPQKQFGISMTNSELYMKSAVVMGRWCEIVNQYFQNIGEYHVFLKD